MIWLLQIFLWILQLLGRSHINRNYAFLPIVVFLKKKEKILETLLPSERQSLTAPQTSSVDFRKRKRQNSHCINETEQQHKDWIRFGIQQTPPAEISTQGATVQKGFPGPYCTSTWWCFLAKSQTWIQIILEESQLHIGTHMNWRIYPGKR